MALLPGRGREKDTVKQTPLGPLLVVPIAPDSAVVPAELVELELVELAVFVESVVSMILLPILVLYLSTC